MNTLEFKAMLKARLLAVPSAKPVQGKGVVMRCVLCGDSSKSMHKKRLNILINENDAKEPIVYNCFNCGGHGFLSSDMLKMMDITDIDLGSNLKRYNKQCSSDMGVRIKYENTKRLVNVFPQLKKRDSIIRKIKYMNDRLDYRVPLEDYETLGLILSIKDYLTVNEYSTHYPDKVIEDLEENYIGFITNLNDYILFRRINNDGKGMGVKHFKFSIIKSTEESKKFMLINRRVDIFSEDPIEIIMAEGPFDILSIIYNIYGGEMYNRLFLAVANGSYDASLKYLIRTGIIGDHVHIKIYSDADSLVNYSRLRDEYGPFVGSFKVFVNTMGKDFGVPRDQFNIGEINLNQYANNNRRIFKR